MDNEQRVRLRPGHDWTAEEENESLSNHVYKDAYPNATIRTRVIECLHYVKSYDHHSHLSHLQPYVLDFLPSVDGLQFHSSV